MTDDSIAEGTAAIDRERARLCRELAEQAKRLGFPEEYEMCMAEAAYYEASAAHKEAEKGEGPQ